MNSNHIIVTVLTVFLFGIQGCAKSTITVPEELSSADYDKRRIRIIDFFSKRRMRYDVVTTTKTKSGQTIDWIKPESQVADGKVATPPSEKFAETKKPKSALDNPYLYRVAKGSSRTQSPRCIS